MAGELKQLLAKGEFIVAPGVFEMFSAKIADRMPFKALYMTGYGATASMLGLPDAGLATYSDMVGRAEMICSVIQTPLIADADTGYGGLLNENALQVSRRDLSEAAAQRQLSYFLQLRNLPVEARSAEIRRNPAFFPQGSRGS